MEIRLYPTANPEQFGLLFAMLSDDDPRPAKEQYHERYQGGWRPFAHDMWKLDADGTLRYPSDPPLKPLVRIGLRDEVITVYPADLVCIRQTDGSFEVARMS